MWVTTLLIVIGVPLVAVAAAYSTVLLVFWSELRNSRRPAVPRVPRAISRLFARRVRVPSKKCGWA